MQEGRQTILISALLDHTYKMKHNGRIEPKNV